MREVWEGALELASLCATSCPEVLCGWGAVSPGGCGVSITNARGLRFMLSVPHMAPEQNPNLYYPEENEGSENQRRVSGTKKTLGTRLRSEPAGAGLCHYCTLTISFLSTKVSVLKCG